MTHVIRLDDEGPVVYRPISKADCDDWFDRNDPGYASHSHGEEEQP